ncbi:MAG: acetylxylan esterase [Verrucomicrobiales bacterium]|nr:acetylxylan esterase [Verrucomicrobiales bacterium]
MKAILRRLRSGSAGPVPGIPLAFLLSSCLLAVVAGERTQRFAATSPGEAAQWREATREALFRLMMGGRRPAAVPLDPVLLRHEPAGADGIRLEELSIQTLPDRRVHLWLALPSEARGRVGAVLALHGHGGTGEQVVRGQGLYWYGRALARLGYVVIAPDIGQHILQHADWSLMGERTWDALRCLDYLETRPEVDADRLAVAGLSLGGETTMYVAALDERIKAACSSGWLTTVANMKNGHCPCWDFPGLEAHFDFADIFACVAPRPLVMEIGELERAPGGFPVGIARGAFAEIRRAYAVSGVGSNAELVVHPSGHVFNGVRFWEILGDGLGRPERREEGDPKSESAEVRFLADAARRLLEGCQVPGVGGHPFYTPDGKGNYRALWTRDFTYMVENAGDLIPEADVEACIQALVAGIREDGAAPDRVRPEGVAVYTAGGEGHPIGEPNIDNAQFLAIAVDTHLRRVDPFGRLALFRAWSGPLDRAMDYIPRGGSGLVYNDPAKPHSPYGFTDTIGKTGELLFESLLYWTACQRLADWHEALGGPRAGEYRRRAALIESNLATLWDDDAGAFVAATEDCRQLDIWGNAFAVWLDFPLGDRRERVIDFLVSQRERFLWRGQVRHLLAGEHWERLLVPIAPERYQNGAYWATASGWMMWALAQRDEHLARDLWDELIQDFRERGIFECINEGYTQLDSYVVSATNPLAAARRLGF